MSTFNTTELWNPKDLEHAFSLVGGPNIQQHLEEAYWVAKRLSPLIENCYNVLEYGCGFGRILVELRKTIQDKLLIGCDFNQQMLHHGQHYSEGYDIQFVCSDGKNIPCIDHGIDFLYTHAVMIHNDSTQISDLFDEFKRVIKPKCKMYHDFLNGDCPSAREESANALKNKFPLYCYPYDVIKFLSNKSGFNLITDPDPTSHRINYIFES